MNSNADTVPFETRPARKSQRHLLSGMSIGRRLLVQTLTMGGVLALIAALAFFSLSYARHTLLDLHHKVDETTAITLLVSGLQRGFVDNLNNLNSGMLTWSDAAKTVAATKARFSSDWNVLRDRYQGDQNDANWMKMKAGVAEVNTAFSEFENLGSNQSRAALELFILNDLSTQIDPFLTAANAYTEALRTEGQSAFGDSETTLTRSLYLGSLIIFLGMTLAIALGIFIRRSIVNPVAAIKATVNSVEAGDTDARTGIVGQDELAALGQALDHLLDEKVAALIQAEQDNETLNESVIELLESTSRLSDRDLTHRLVVREDVTGPVADSLNLMTKELSEALVSIRKVGDYVGVSSVTVDEQTRKVVHVAAQERQLVEQARQKLDVLSLEMARISDWCQSCNQIAQHASTTTDKAFEAVGNTVSSMDEIRDSISETEKRIKRLSERSQEISSIVDIISSIAERTHVLALNASMQAAAAGDAGRGFAVVADEVQRLAESSRGATSQISGLVRNIQMETADAVDTMNRSITQVVNGSRRAEQAGVQMQETQTTTRELVTSVERISVNSLAQASEAEALKAQAERIVKSTQMTDQELTRQSHHTERLRAASKILQKTVDLFELPEIKHIELDLPEAGNDLEPLADTESNSLLKTAS
ncbi:MAG: methyl-accepting chemotaxis protein [Hahellaceae bacterium]|nr:methyl-accepting chemotaxis protein [Hahellaceae bacterium]MCP5168965.1 methyl-accepting chemotaxis protein [Hahellaceae bacterium]